MAHTSLWSIKYVVKKVQVAGEHVDDAGGMRWLILKALRYNLVGFFQVSKHWSFSHYNLHSISGVVSNWWATYLHGLMVHELMVIVGYVRFP